MKRCSWCNESNSLYVEYHDKEWCRKNINDKYLFEMLILECFQAGLSWECILNKRENFRKSYDDFNVDIVMNYDAKKIEELKGNKGIIKNGLKIKSSVENAKVFKSIQIEFGSFYKYLTSFVGDKTYYEVGNTTNYLSDLISNDLRKRGMKFVGSTVIYSYLQSIGVIYSHDKDCYLYRDM